MNTHVTVKSEWFCSRCNISLRIDRGLMQTVEHQMVYSPERKKNGYITNIISHFFQDIRITMVTIFSLCQPLILLHHARNGFFSISSHVFAISEGFQLTLFPRVRRAGSLTPLFLQTGSWKLWIQTTACFFVGHRYPPEKLQGQRDPQRTIGVERGYADPALDPYLVYYLARSGFLVTCM